MNSFNENILKMHPLIQPIEIYEWVSDFLDKLPRVGIKIPKPRPLNELPIEEDCFNTLRSTRKHHLGQEPEESIATKFVKVGKPERTIRSAVVLTILALGKICLHQDKDPDALHDPERFPDGTAVPRNGMPSSPGQGSLPSHSAHSQFSGLTSSENVNSLPPSGGWSIRLQGGGFQGYRFKKNYESIPGLEYLAFATDILGNLMGSYQNIEAVYADIFVSLYFGQLVRPLESFAYIQRAGHKRQVIMLS